MQDQAAIIEELHQRYAGALYDKCVRMLGDKTEAEDAVQQTFLNAFRSLRSFRQGESYLPWLYVIATNVCLHFLRTRKRKHAKLASHPEDFSPAVAENSAQNLHIRRSLERVLVELDERGQQLFVAHYIDGMDQGQIARHLGISRRAVVKRLSALRVKMSSALEEKESHGELPFPIFPRPVGHRRPT